MVFRVRKKPPAKRSYARLAALAKGRIVGLREQGVPREEIRDRVRKKDGKPPSVRAVDAVVSRFEQNPDWDGEEHHEAGGRPRHLRPKQEQKIKKILLEDVGKHVVCASYVKRRLPELRKFSNKTITRTFDRLGYGYRYRRSKAAIGQKYKPARLKYCDWLLKQPQGYLNKFAYIDGTTFWLPRTEEENRDKNRACLGKRVWRLKDGSDSLEDGNVGPSSYAKSQGRSVKIWGLLFNGRLEYWLLPEKEEKRQGSESMTGARYNHMVKTHLAKWRRQCYPNFPKGEKVPLVKDFERFLRWGKDQKDGYDNLKAEREAGFETVKQHPKCSPDLNAIEGWWDVLQDRLLVTAPVELESRADFVKRLRRTAAWLNANARAHALKLCTNQKKRATQIKKLQGARCQW